MEFLSLEETNPSFTLFQLLPVELRLKIWISTFAPRIVELRLKWRPLPNNTEAIHFESFCPLPVTLFVNCESRYETLRHYHLSFESKDHYPNTSPQTYINFFLDTIYLDYQTFDLLERWHRPRPDPDPGHPLLRFLASTTKSNSNKIRHLAIDEKIWLGEPQPYDRTNLPSERQSKLANNAKAIRKFEGLEDLIIVHHGVSSSAPCAYSYLRKYELHKNFIEDRKKQWLRAFGHYTESNYVHAQHYKPGSRNYRNTPSNTPDEEVFVRFLDKPSWSPEKKIWSPILRGEGMGIRNLLGKREFDERYNEIGEIPIYGWDLVDLERGELRFWDLGGEDFMDGVRRGCVAEDTRALEWESAFGEGGAEWVPPVVSSVGLIRNGMEC